MRFVCLSFGILFLVFTSLQFNDAGQYNNHDWWSWVIIYLATAGLSLWRAFLPLPSAWLWSSGGFALGAFVFRMQDEFGNFAFKKFAGRWLYNDSGTEMVQQTNEAGGLLIVAIWLLVLAALNRTR